MCPITHGSLLAMGIAVIASFIFGYTWYGPLFGKVWADLMGIKMDPSKCGKPPVSALLLTVLGNIFTTTVLAYILTYKPSCNFGAALFIWLGFYVPVQMGVVLWEGKPWKLFALNVSYYFLNLQLIAAILTYIR